jgi:tRNA nucleotidyltransferase (CCA-adding enzyme)
MVDPTSPRFTNDPALPRWEHFPHQADVGVRGLGPTRESAFEQAASALTAAICDPNLVATRDALELQCEAPDEELLLVEWLNAVIFEMATRRMLFRDFKVAIEGHRLHARLRGEPIDPARHQPAVEVKGATMTELKVWRDEDNGWIAQCVVDV